MNDQGQEQVRIQLDVLCREPVYAWSKNIVEVLLLNEIEIAHWCVLMKKLHWTPPSMFSLYDILLFTAFTAKQYYCHPNEFPVYTFKIDHDRPGFVMMHSRWAKHNCITLRAWEVNKKFNKLKVPLENYNQASFGAEKLQLPQENKLEPIEDQQLELQEREGAVVIVQQKSNESEKQRKMEDDIDEIVRQLEQQQSQQQQLHSETLEEPSRPKPVEEEKSKSPEVVKKIKQEQKKLKEDLYQQDFQPFKYSQDIESLVLQQQTSFQDLQEQSEINDDVSSVTHFLLREQSFR